MTGLRSLSLVIPLLMLSGCDRPAEPIEPVASGSGMSSTPASVPVDAAPPATPPLTSTAPAAVSTAQALLMPTQGRTAGGEISFQSEESGLRITGRVTGLTASATHGFHIHEIGDCSAPDASSAGGHFNPTSLPHGQVGADPHHAGDMPNLQADAQGEVAVDLLLPSLEIGSSGPRDVLGRAVVVHEQADDYATQPAGNSGARIACGVIGRVLTAPPTAAPDAGDPR